MRSDRSLTERILGVLRPYASNWSGTLIEPRSGSSSVPSANAGMATTVHVGFRSAKRRAVSSAIQRAMYQSMPIGRCGPCTSSALTGTNAIERARSKRRI